MKKLSLLLLTFTLFYAIQCTPAVDKEIEVLNKDLMTGHDDIMPKSMKLGSLRDDVLTKATEGGNVSKSEAAKIANNLQAAEDDMYKWMSDYSAAMNDEPDKTKKVKMYRTLKVEVERISANTDSAMQAASDFIASKK
jgi:hypothetical protein